MKRPPVSVGSLRGMVREGEDRCTLRSGPSGGFSPMALIEEIHLGPAATVAVPEVDERAARRTLRDQIARLERELASACLDAYPRIHSVPPAAALAAGPRLLTLGELERVRDG